MLPMWESASCRLFKKLSTKLTWHQHLIKKHHLHSLDISQILNTCDEKCSNRHIRMIYYILAFNVVSYSPFLSAT